MLAQSSRWRNLAVHTVLVTNEHFTIQDLVVAENVVQHLLIETVLRRRCEGDFHATSLLVLQIDISVPALACCGVCYTSDNSRGLLVESDTDSLQFSF
jgi:hypothetical protein